MDVVPVIDIRHGIAVHAVKGERARYKPLETALAKSADPIEVALGIHTLYPFTSLYVADLDGIEGRGAEAELQRRIVSVWPGTSVWVDDGAITPAIPPDPAALGGKRLTVIGSETLPPRLARPTGARRGVTAAGGQPRSSEWNAGWDPGRWILSLDFHDEELLGPDWLLEEPSLWPQRVIAMTVRRVGTGAGADLATVARIAKLADGRKVYAAGGVRDPRDLKALHDAGAAGALVATALHAGTIKAGELGRLASL